MCGGGGRIRPLKKQSLLLESAEKWRQKGPQSSEHRGLLTGRTPPPQRNLHRSEPVPKNTSFQNNRWLTWGSDRVKGAELAKKEEKRMLNNYISLMVVSCLRHTMPQGCFLSNLKRTMVLL